MSLKDGNIQNTVTDSNKVSISVSSTEGDGSRRNTNSSSKDWRFMEETGRKSKHW
jgi:hypothetical protein